MTTYFYATPVGARHPMAYLLVEIKDQHCQLHGDYIGKQVVGRRIKVSGNVANSMHVLNLDQLTPESRAALSPTETLSEKET